MVNFLIIFIIEFVKQLLLLGSFAFSIKLHNYNNIAITIPILLLIGYLVFYFLYSENITAKLKMKKIFYDLYGFLSWIISGFLIWYIIIDLDDRWNFLPKLGGFLSGVEYILIPFFLGIYIVVLGIIKVIIYIIKRIYNK